MRTVLVFDLNGTLFDLSALDSHFAQLENPGSQLGQALREEWFGVLERLWMTELVINAYTPFDKLAQTALRMTMDKWSQSSESPHASSVAAPEHKESVIDQLVHAAADTLGISSPSSAAASAILDQLKALLPFPDVAAGLARLQQAGYRLAALTNGTLSSAKTLLQQADLADYFEDVFSADQIKRYKPALQAYELAASRLHVNLSDILMVAAHDWDITGANAAGCATAFLQRPGKVLNPRGPKPDVQARDLLELAGLVMNQPNL